MAFTSTGGKGGPLGSYEGRRPPMYKIQGEIFHRIGSLMPEQNCAPVFSQLFVYDHGEALQYQMNRNPERRCGTMETLQRVMDNCNPFVQVYKQAHELTEGMTLPEFHLRLDFLRATDQWHYNDPCSAHELATIIPGDVDSCANARDVITTQEGVHLCGCQSVIPCTLLGSSLCLHQLLSQAGTRRCYMHCAKVTMSLISPGPVRAEKR